MDVPSTSSLDEVSPDILLDEDGGDETMVIEGHSTGLHHIKVSSGSSGSGDSSVPQGAVLKKPARAVETNVPTTMGPFESHFSSKLVKGFPSRQEALKALACWKTIVFIMILVPSAIDMLKNNCFYNDFGAQCH